MLDGKGGVGKIDNPFVRWCSTCMWIGGLPLIGLSCVGGWDMVVVEGVEGAGVAGTLEVMDGVEVLLPPSPYLHTVPSR